MANPFRFCSLGDRANHQACRSSNSKGIAMRNRPSTHGANGSVDTDGDRASLNSNKRRDAATGRFTKGWRGGKGNPLAGKVA